MLIFAVLAAACYRLLTFTTMFLEHGESLQSELYNSMSLERTLQLDFSQLINKAPKEIHSYPNPVIGGNEHQLIFSSIGLQNPDYSIHSELQRIFYVASSINNNIVLRRYHTQHFNSGPYFSSANALITLDITKLKTLPSVKFELTNIVDLRFSYLDTNNNSHNFWPTQDTDSKLKAINILIQRAQALEVAFTWRAVFYE